MIGGLCTKRLFQRGNPMKPLIVFEKRTFYDRNIWRINQLRNPDFGWFLCYLVRAVQGTYAYASRIGTRNGRKSKNCKNRRGSKPQVGGKVSSFGRANAHVVQEKWIKMATVGRTITDAIKKYYWKLCLTDWLGNYLRFDNIGWCLFKYFFHSVESTANDGQRQQQWYKNDPLHKHWRVKSFHRWLGANARLSLIHVIFIDLLSNNVPKPFLISVKLKKIFNKYKKIIDKIFSKGIKKTDFVQEVSFLFEYFKKTPNIILYLWHFSFV